MVEPNGCGGEGEGKVEPGQQQGQVLSLVLAALRKSVVLPCQMADAHDPAGAAWGWRSVGPPTSAMSRTSPSTASAASLSSHSSSRSRSPARSPVPGTGFGTHLCSVSSSIADASLNSFEQRERVRGVAGVNAVRLRRQGQLGAQDPPAHAREVVHAGWTQGAYSVLQIDCSLKSSQIDSFWTFSRIFQAEGIFRITPENSREEHVREQLNNGIVPDDIDVHCLASLIKVDDTILLCFLRRFTAHI
jgi:hypothetical protein